jgi:hypothetical protein
MVDISHGSGGAGQPWPLNDPSFSFVEPSIRVRRGRHEGGRICTDVADHGGVSVGAASAESTAAG